MELVEKIFKKSGWISIIESLIFVILGILLIINPEGILKTIAYILGGIFIVVGGYKIFNYFTSKGKYDFFNYDLIYGLMAVIIGIVTIAYSSTISTILRVIVGVWIIYSSFMRIGLSVKLKAQGFDVWIYSLVLALVMLALGIFITLNQGAITITIGIMMIISSVIDIVEDIIFMRNVKEIF